MYFVCNVTDVGRVLTRGLESVDPRSKTSFIGHVRQLLFKNKPYLEFADQGNALLLMGLHTVTLNIPGEI